MTMHLAQELIDLEKSLFADEVRSSLEKAAALLHDDFIEISQSGRRYGKAEVLDSFARNPASGSQYKASEFQVRLLAGDLAQVLFETISIPKSDTVPRRALRSSVWKFHDGRWQMIFHQGTIKGD